eukprot:Sspe_Gene.28278::Locus_12706_Transcript_1_2_Confidence_0.800_Length_1742::g.28278::m.28278
MATPARKTSYSTPMDSARPHRLYSKTLLPPPPLPSADKVEVPPRSKKRTQFARVPEGGKLVLPEGSIGHLISAIYRVEDSSFEGLEKDVTGVVAKHVKHGGLDFTVSNRKLGIERDPFPSHPKVLIVTYEPDDPKKRKEKEGGGDAGWYSAAQQRHDPFSNFLRVPEGSSLHLPSGSIVRLINAEYRVEGMTKVGLTKDVTDIVSRGMYDGGLNIEVNNRTMGVMQDPHPGKEKVLVINYIPHGEPDVVTTSITEREYLDLPPGTIQKLISAEYRLPYDEDTGHGWTVNVKPVVGSYMTPDGALSMPVTHRALRIDYDPFPDHAKVLTIKYLPFRMKHQRAAPRERPSAIIQNTLDTVDRLMCPLYRCPFQDPKTLKLDDKKKKLLDAVVAVLKGIESGTPGASQRLGEVMRTLEEVQQEVHGTVEEDVAQRLVGLGRNAGGGSYTEILSRLGFDEGQCRSALHLSQGSLHKAARQLCVTASRAPPQPLPPNMTSFVGHAYHPSPRLC